MLLKNVGRSNKKISGQTENPVYLQNIKSCIGLRGGFKSITFKTKLCSLSRKNVFAQLFWTISLTYLHRHFYSIKQIQLCDYLL